MAQKLKQFKGALTPEQITEGMNAARQNAHRLAKDARLLLEEGSAATAVALAALSIEESGKLPILRELAVARDGRDLKDGWRAFRSHRAKNAHWLLVEYAKSGARTLEDFRGLFDPDADHRRLLDHVKQIALYTDCVGHGSWSSPASVIPSSLAESLVRTAERLLRQDPVRLEEIELWVKHIKPVWKQSMEEMRRALLTWYRALEERGLRKPEGPSMEEFLYGSGKPTEEAQGE